MLYIYLVVLGVCVVCDWLAFRDWRGGPFLGVGGANALTVSFGRAAQSSSTAVLPVATYAMTAMMLSGVVSELAGRVHGGPLLHFLTAVQPVVDTAAVVLLALTAGVFLFMQPRFLVPPPFRGRPGYVPALWKRLRQ